MTETVTPIDGALSVDQAIESLTAPIEDDAAPAEAAEQQEIEAEPTAEEPADEAEALEGEGETEEVEAVAPVEPPKYWAKEAKEAFANLPPELQAVVLAQEGPREEAAAKAKEQAAQETARARGDLAKVQQIVDGLSELVPKAIQTFKDRWEGVDWAETARVHGAEQTMIWQAEAAEQAEQIRQLNAAKADAEQTARVAFVQAEAEKLRGTPLETVEARQEVAKYLLEQSPGFRERIADADADDFLIAHKAMLWDRAQAQLKAKPPTKTVAPVKQAVRPAAGAASPNSNGASKAANRFAQTRSVDDAVALLMQKGS